MYTRSYFTEDKKVDIPENYDGNAFRENCGNYVLEDTDSNGNFQKEEIPPEEKRKDSECTAKPFSPFERFSLEGVSKLLPFRGFKNIFTKSTDFRFGTEEILICIIALYMFFSKDGDKECAIMLALLLFVR